jgi:predicted transcriptional regulator
MNLPQHIIDEVLILHRDGLPIKRIAFMMNLSEETVQKIIDLNQEQTTTPSSTSRE